MKIKIKSGDTVIEYEEETVPFKNDSLYKSDMTLKLVKSLADKVIEIDNSRYGEEGEAMSETQVKEPLELIADNEEDLVVLSLKSKLVMLISRIIESKGMTQKEAAKVMEVTQPRVSNLMNGSLSLFSVDTLLIMAMKIGVDVNVFMDSNRNIFMTSTH